MQGTKYLTEILNVNDIWNDERYSFIIAGTGGGKTTFAKELLKKSKNALYLVDTNNLEYAMKVELKGYTHVTVMTYKSFGMKFNSFVDVTGSRLKQYDLIIGDEIHQLGNYYFKYADVHYFQALELLMSRHDDIKKVLLTATPCYFEMINKKFNNAIGNLYTRYDVYKNPDLIQYEILYTDYFHNYHQIENILKYNISERNLNKYKFLIYTPKITTMEYLSNVCTKVGLRPMMIWSKNAENKEMSQEQIEFKEYLLKGEGENHEGRGYYKGDINCLIINDSSVSGINIYDDVQYVIIDSDDPTTRSQIRGRIRHDIIMISLKSNGTKKELVKTMEIDDKWLNKPLTTGDKKELALELNWTDDKGRVMKWTGVKNALVESGYEVKDTQRRIEGKQTKVTIISKKCNPN